MAGIDQDEAPILTAVSSSARQLYLLLRCIAFSTKANVQLTEDGLRISVNEASSMEASAFLDKSLFTTYTYHAPPSPPPTVQDSESSSSTPESVDPSPTFQISLPAILETLQIFGLVDPNTSRPPWARDNPYPSSTTFSNNILGMNNLCRVIYHHIGAPLSVTLTEASIRTQCDLTTYEAAHTDGIPFSPQALACKVIMPASWLFDAISELSSTTPDKLTMYAKTLRGKHFLVLSAEGTLGSARVEFNNRPQPSAVHENPTASSRDGILGTGDGKAPMNLFETFQLSDPDMVLKSTYKFSLVQKAVRAMSVAKKVSLRIDEQGVLSANFMVSIDSGGSGTTTTVATDGGGADDKVSFVHFKFVPLVDEDEDDERADDTMIQGGYGSDSDQDDEL